MSMRRYINDFKSILKATFESSLKDTFSILEDTFSILKATFSILKDTFSILKDTLKKW